MLFELIDCVVVLGLVIRVMYVWGDFIDDEVVFGDEEFNVQNVDVIQSIQDLICY